VTDGEAVVLGVDDLNALDGDDLRRLPASMRKTSLARLLARRPDGIFVAPFEQGEIASHLFLAACNMGLEGLVSKRRDRPYQAGRSKHWVKVKNRTHLSNSESWTRFANSKSHHSYAERSRHW
jgi:bifunctional non-homologous end joining protein LigD